jgi:hypothetical protein
VKRAVNVFERCLRKTVDATMRLRATMYVLFTFWGGVPYFISRKNFNMSTPTLLTLEEITSINPALVNANIRIDKTTQQASVIDVIRLITGFKSSDATKTLTRLGVVLKVQCHPLRINGVGKITPVCDAQTMVQIIWELPGKTAKAFRRQCAHYIVRILGGDASLIEEMQDRAEVVDVSQRDFFLGKRGTKTREKDELASRKLKLRRKEAEIEKLEAETKLYVKDGEAKLEKLEAETKLYVKDGEAKLEQRKIEMNKSSVTFYRDLVQEMFSEDTHMKAAFKDYAMVTLGQGSVEGSLAQFAPDISTIITNMGFRGQCNSTLCRIGKSVAKSYREMYGSAPKKTEKYVNGSVRYVNAYMQSDVAMIQEIHPKPHNKKK